MASIKLKGDTSGEITIQAPSVAGTNTLNLQASSGTLATTAQASVGTKNLIINGDMRIAQRGTSVSSISSSNDYYTCDRWRLGVATAGTWTQTQDTDVPTGQGFANSFKVACTTANASLSANSTLFIQQRIEGQNLQYLKYGTSNAENITVSLWVKSNKTGTYVVELYDNDNTKHIGKTFTISSANTWEKKTLTFSGNTLNNFDNDNNLSLQIVFWLAGGTDSTSGTLPSSWSTVSTANRAAGQTVNLADSTSNYINITGVQLEVGTEATPFENRMYSTELAMCQRYYYNSIYAGGDAYVGGFGICTTSNANNIRCSALYPVTMRTSPSITFDSSDIDGIGGFGSPTAVDIGTQGIRTISVNNGTTGRVASFAFKASAEL